MFGGGINNNFYGFPVFLLALNGENRDNGSKLEHDTYRVYVNRDYVGDKTLVAQNEKIEDVEKYLRNKGFDHFSTRLDGNEYVISSQGTETMDMKDTLRIYLNMR
jgi:homoserine acetyltransferase